MLETRKLISLTVLALAIALVVSAAPAGAKRDRTPPDTMILSAVDGSERSVSDGRRTASSTITFTFEAVDTSGIQYLYCELDSLGFVPCYSPWTTTKLALGPHTFQVYSVDNVGLVDPTPATFTWRVRH